MFGFLYSWFVNQPGPKISGTKTQTLPNLFILHPLLITDLEQVVEHCAGSLPHEHDEAAQVDGDADRGESHDDIPEEKEGECRNAKTALSHWDCLIQ